MSKREVGLHFIVKTKNGNRVEMRCKYTEESQVLEMFGTMENYIDFLKEKYEEEYMDDYDLEVVVEFIGIEEM